MHRVGIIVPGNRKYLPYVEYYVNILEKYQIDYRLMTWDKAGIPEESDMVFDFRTRDTNRKRMLYGYFRFLKKCKKYIVEQQIDKVIFLTLAPAFFMEQSFLRKRGIGYILDIRDDSPLRKSFFRRFRKVCQGAECLMVSSPYFNRWIPRDTVVCHNVDVNRIAAYLQSPVKRREGETVSIVYAGMMIEPDCNIRMLDLLRQDSRFRFYYIGRPGTAKEKVLAFTRQAGMTNVYAEGTYNREDIVEIYRTRGDFANILRSDTEINRNALPNRLYDAAVSGVPAIVYSHNELIAQYVEKYRLGLSVDEDRFAADPGILYRMIAEFDYDAYEKGRAEFLRTVLSEMKIFEETLLRLVSD